MTKRAIILGVGSDIGCEIAHRLRADDWRVFGFLHTDPLFPFTSTPDWDLVVCCYGSLEPIGSFWQTRLDAWEASFFANLFLPLRQIRELYPHHAPNASVCFFSGAGTSGPAPTYSAYAASKVTLVKMTELMDDESPDCKFFILGPGMVRTKIHDATMKAGSRAANYGRVQDFVSSSIHPGTSYEAIYAVLMACVAAPKAAVGGRNLYVPGDDFARLDELAGDRDQFKLRRCGDESLRGPLPDFDAEARKRYENYTDNHPTVHSNRFPTWGELSDEQKTPWRNGQTTQ